MKIRNEKSIATIYDAVSILKGLDIINGSLKQNYYAESALFVPDRFINPLILRPKIDISDPSGSIPNGDKVDELSRLEWFENGVKINSNDDFKIEGANLTVLKNSEEPFEISYRAEWFDSRKKQVITIEDSVIVSCISLAQSDANVTMSLSKPQNWVHNPLKGERIYTINAYVSKDKVHESAVEWYYVDGNKKDKLIDSSCSFYVEGQYTNALKVDSAYMDNVIIKAKNISNDKLKEIYWFFDKHGNPVTHKTPEKTEVKGANVFSLPSSPTVAKLDYRIEGLTVQNLVNDLYKKTTRCSVNNTKEGKWEWVSLNEESKDIYVSFDSTESVGDVLYSYIKFDSIAQIRVGIINGDTMALSSYKESLFDSSYLKVKEFKDNNVAHRFYIDNTNKNQKYTSYINIVNLTKSFGAGNEPSKEWCDANLPNYIEGTKSVQTPMRVKSVGENLFNPNVNIINKNVYSEEFFDGSRCVRYLAAVSVSKKPFCNLNLPAGKYIIKVRWFQNEKTGAGLIIYYEDGTTFEGARRYSSDDAGWVTSVGETNSKKIIGLGGTYNASQSVWIDLNSLYVGISDEASKYQESLAYFNDEIELGSVTTTKDYIEDGKLYKNTKRYYFTKEDEWKPINSYEGDNFRYYTTLPFEYRATGAGVKGDLICNNFTPTKNISGSTYILDSNTISLYSNNSSTISSTIYLTLDKKVTDVNGEMPEGTFIDVILPETEVINLDVVGSIKTESNGTVFIEPVTYTEQQYNDGIKTKFPIVEIESIKVGTKYLDVSKAVIKDNLITHPDLENGDFVTVTYYYDSNPIYGTNSIGYLSLEEILDDLWLDNVYTYKITNGEWELVKVTDIEDYEEWLKTEKTSPYTLALDGVIFGSYEAETKFIRQYPSSLYVDIIAPTRLKEGITQIKARALVGTADGVIENPSKYFDISWYKKSNKAGASDVIIGEGEELTINVADVDRIGIEVESKTIKE